MNGFFGSMPSRQEMEIEEEFERAFSLLRRTPGVSAVDIGVNGIPDGITRWRLEELSENYGLQLEFHPSGHVTIRRAARAEIEKTTTPLPIIAFAMDEASGIKNWLSDERLAVQRRLHSWNVGFEGLHEGVR